MALTAGAAGFLRSRMRTVAQAAKNSSVPESLIRAVIRQLGGTDSLEDVAKHGADGGFAGFTYTKEAAEFFKRHRAAISDLVKTYADDFGSTSIQVVEGFKCFKGADAETKESIGRMLYGAPLKTDEDYTVANCLAWFALEETARAMTDE